jgi:hypothetical protein
MACNDKALRRLPLPPPALRTSVPPFQFPVCPLAGGRSTDFLEASRTWTAAGPPRGQAARPPLLPGTLAAACLVPWNSRPAARWPLKCGMRCFPSVCWSFSRWRSAWACERQVGPGHLQPGCLTVRLCPRTSDAMAVEFRESVSLLDLHQGLRHTRVGCTCCRAQERAAEPDPGLLWGRRCSFAHRCARPLAAVAHRTSRWGGACYRKHSFSSKCVSGLALLGAAPAQVLGQGSPRDALSFQRAHPPAAVLRTACVPQPRW